MAKKEKKTITKKATGERIEQKRVMKDVEFVFTEKELTGLTREAGETSTKIEKWTGEFTKIKKDWKDKIDQAQLELKAALRKVRNGKENRTVSCVERKNFADKTVQYVYKGDIVMERDMVEDERQTEMPVVHSAGKKWDKGTEVAATVN